MNTARYKHWWYGIVFAMICHYANGSGNTEQGRIIEKAVEKAIKATAKYDNYRYRLQVIELIFYRGYSIPKAANMVHVSERTAQRWKNQFVNEVGKNAGFE